MRGIHKAETFIMSWPVITAALLLLAYSGGCSSTPPYDAVITAKQTYTFTARELVALKDHFTDDEKRLIAAADNEAYDAVKLLVAKFLANEPVTAADVWARLRSAMLKLARYQFEGEARRAAARATTRPVSRVDEGPLPPPDWTYQRNLLVSH